MSRPDPDGSAEAATLAPGLVKHPVSARSLRVHALAIDAARELLEEGGLGSATVDAISARSGVSKATLYKHWPSRTAIAAEAFGEWMAGSLPLPDTGSARGDLTEQVRRVSAFYGSSPGIVFAQLLAACVSDPQGAAYFREFFLTGRRAAIEVLWNRALERNEVDPSIDVGVATDLLFGPLIFRLMSGHEKLSAAEAERIAAAALNGLLR